MLIYIHSLQWNGLQEVTVFGSAAHEVGGEGLRDLKASDVSPRTALLSWMPPANPGRSFRLTYQTEGHQVKVGTVWKALF